MEATPEWASEPTVKTWKLRYGLLEESYRDVLNELVQMRAWEENCEQFRRMYKSSEERNKFLQEDNNRLREIVGSVHERSVIAAQRELTLFTGV